MKKSACVVEVWSNSNEANRCSAAALAAIDELGRIIAKHRKTINTQTYEEIREKYARLVENQDGHRKAVILGVHSLGETIHKNAGAMPTETHDDLLQYYKYVWNRLGNP